MRQLTAAGKGEQGHVRCGLGDVMFPIAARRVGEPTTTLPLIRFKPAQAALDHGIIGVHPGLAENKN